MGLGVKKGNEVVFTFDGEDEEAAYEKVTAFVQVRHISICGGLKKIRCKRDSLLHLNFCV